MKILLSISISILCLSVCAQSDIDMVKSTVTMPRVKAHMNFIASDELQGRKIGTLGIETAAQYIKTQLMSYGVHTAPEMDDYFQNVPLSTMTPPSSGSINTSGQEYEFGTDFVVLGGVTSQRSEEYVFLDHKAFEKIKAKKVKGKIVITVCGDGESKSVQGWFYQSADKIDRLREAGATGLIELYSSNQVPYKFLKQQFTKKQTSLVEEEADDFMHIWINGGDEKKVGNLKDDGELDLDIYMPEKEKIDSKNVVGFVEGTDPNLKDEYIVYSAHYDHVGIGRPDANMDSIFNGARDNAVGVTAVLELARNIAKHPTKRSAIFVLFTAEESGLLGSSFFVDHAPVALEDIVYNFNIDNGGYNDTTIVSVVGLERTTAESNIQTACASFGLTGIEDPAKEQGLFDRSDNVNFAVKGIPAPTFSLGFTSFDAEIFKYYHQAADNVDSLDFDYLFKYFKSYVLASRQIANSAEAPFWIKGDKYYDAGVKLYNR